MNAPLLRSKPVVRRRLAVLLVFFSAMACVDPSTSVAPRPGATANLGQAALEGDVRPSTIFNRYVVVLRRNVPSAAVASATLVAEVGGLRFYVYETALKGFAVANLPPRGLEILRRNPMVVSVEEDKIQMPGDVQYFTFPTDSGRYLLDRIDQRSLPLDWQYEFASSGRNTHVYIV